MSLEFQGLRAVCPNRICDHPDCPHVLGGVDVLAYQVPGGIMVVHVGCAPAEVRKAYYDRQREEARK